MKLSIIVILLMLISSNVFPRTYAASISYKQVQSLTYEFNLLVYQDTINIWTSVNIEINGSYITLNEQSVNIIDDVAIVSYTGNHTFASSGSYTILADLGNREGGIWNIPNSINVLMGIKAEITVGSYTPNNSAYDSIALIDTVLVDSVLMVDLSMNDSDNDSLSYTLLHCRNDDGFFVNGYSFPDQYPDFQLDSITGILLWDSPSIEYARYSILLSVEEWRAGIMISRTEHERYIIIKGHSGINTKENSVILGIDIFPNPSSESLQISTKLNISNANYQINNVIGKSIKKGQLKDNDEHIYLKDFKPGVYILSIIVESKKYSQKFIIQ
ncbi:MAG: T9SS type A sorting domain-containing protein [Bacteroidales bacterium]|nr:T9SS type A sorting domain-containing protein [Bacteroidales bacterium]